MMTSNDAVLRIAVVGQLGTAEHAQLDSETEFQKMLDQSIRYVQQYATDAYGVNCDRVNVFFVCHPFYTDQSVRSMLNHSFAGFEIVEPAPDDNEVRHADCDSAQNRFGTADDLTASWISDQSDFAVIFGQGDQNAAILMHCKIACIPAIVIPACGELRSFWIQQLCREDFQMKHLESYISSLFPSMDSFSKQADLDRSVFGYKLLWGGLYKRFIKKHRNRNTQETLHYDPSQGIGENDFPAETRARAAFEALHKQYEIFDQTSIRYADKYWSTIYLRAIIPWITTIALAIGFYTESILSPWPVVFHGTSLQLWSVIAGIGFFVHALLNLYVFRLSQSRVISSWHVGYIDHRFIAEALRLAMHFEPFGIPINFERYQRYGSNRKPDSDIYQRLSFSTRMIAPVAFTDDLKDKQLCLKRLNALIDDQIVYHKKTANRFKTIYERLERYAQVVFFIGFGFVLLRGILQLLISFQVLPADLSPRDVSMVKSYANMLALLIPTWATYFTLKLSLCNFRNLHADNAAMAESLKSIRLDIEAIQQKRNPLQEDFSRLSGLMVSTMLGEITQWYGQIESRKITNL